MINVRQLRADFGLSRADLAAMCQVDPGTVWRWEHDGVPDRGAATALLMRIETELRGNLERSVRL